MNGEPEGKKFTVFDYFHGSAKDGDIDTVFVMTLPTAMPSRFSSATNRPSPRTGPVAPRPDRFNDEHLLTAVNGVVAKQVLTTEVVDVMDRHKLANSTLLGSALICSKRPVLRRVEPKAIVKHLTGMAALDLAEAG